MSRNYKFHNPAGLYFVSFAVVGWLGETARRDSRGSGVLVRPLERIRAAAVVCWLGETTRRDSRGSGVLVRPREGIRAAAVF